MPYAVLDRLQRDIAQLQHDDAGFGTGRLVAENLILTAAHTLWNNEKGTGPELDGWQVRLARDRGAGPWSPGYAWPTSTSFAARSAAVMPGLGQTSFSSSPMYSACGSIPRVG